MQIGVIGLNHKSACVELREKIARSSLKRFGADCSLHGELPYVLLTTCNRTEIYFSSVDLAATHSYLLSIFRNEIAEEFEHTIYSYFGRECFFHLAKVTCGMDSAILGETEIQGQVKLAYEAASFRFLSRELHFLFQKSLKIGKEFRSTPAPSLSLEETLFQLMNRVYSTLSDKKVLFVGISDINQKILNSFRFKGLSNIACCNRTEARLSELPHEVQRLRWDEQERLFDFDVIIYGTKAPSYLLRASQIKVPTEKKLLIDLSVPRNVDPEVGTVKNVLLYNIDEIHFSIDGRTQAAAYRKARVTLPFIFSCVERQYYLFKKKENYILSNVS
jgi:glutamyl-tRNA reductase